MTTITAQHDCTTCKLFLSQKNTVFRQRLQAQTVLRQAGTGPQARGAVCVRTLDFALVQVWLPHQQRRSFPVERVRGVGVQQELGQEHLKHVDQVCTGGTHPLTVSKHFQMTAHNEGGWACTLENNLGSSTEESATSKLLASASFPAFKPPLLAPINQCIWHLGAGLGTLTKHGTPPLIDDVEAHRARPAKRANQKRSKEKHRLLQLDNRTPRRRAELLPKQSCQPLAVQSANRSNAVPIFKVVLVMQDAIRREDCSKESSI